MNPFLLIGFLVIATTASPYYGSINSPVRVSYGSHVFSGPSSYYRRYSTPYSRHTEASPVPAIFSQPDSSISYSPASYYSSSSSPSTSSSFSSPYAKGESNAAIISFNRNIHPSNSDTTSFTTSNGISSSHNVQVVHGRPSYYQDGQTVQSDTTITMNGHSYHQSPEGMHVSLTWNANENGFSPQGDHLPNPVPLPAEHAEAHRQANLVATPSPSGGYGSSSAPGYGRASTRNNSNNYYASPPLSQSVSHSTYNPPAQQSSYRPAVTSQPSQGYY